MALKRLTRPLRQMVGRRLSRLRASVWRRDEEAAAAKARRASLKRARAFADELEARGFRFEIPILQTENE